MRERERGGSRRGRGRGEVREHLNEPMWARSGGRDGEGCPNIRMSLCGLVLVFETRERERGGARAPERARVGTFWWSRWGGVPKHQNDPVWGRSGVRDEGEGEGRCASTRTCPHGLILVFYILEYYIYLKLISVLYKFNYK